MAVVFFQVPIDSISYDMVVSPFFENTGIELTLAFVRKHVARACVCVCVCPPGFVLDTGNRAPLDLF